MNNKLTFILLIGGVVIALMLVAWIPSAWDYKSVYGDPYPPPETVGPYPKPATVVPPIVPTVTPTKKKPRKDEPDPTPTMWPFITPLIPIPTNIGDIDCEAHKETCCMLYGLYCEYP